MGTADENDDVDARTALLRLLFAAVYSCEPHALVNPVPRVAKYVEEQWSWRGGAKKNNSKTDSTADIQLDVQLMRNALSSLPESPFTLNSKESISELQQELLHESCNHNLNSLPKLRSVSLEHVITALHAAQRGNANQQRRAESSIQKAVASLQELRSKFNTRAFQVTLAPNNAVAKLHEQHASSTTTATTTAFGFHGSSAEHWYSILHNGLRTSVGLDDNTARIRARSSTTASTTAGGGNDGGDQPRTKNGQVYGEGIYLSWDAMVAAGFAPVGTARWSCIAVVEYVSSSSSASASLSRAPQNEQSANNNAMIHSRTPPPSSSSLSVSSGNDYSQIPAEYVVVPHGWMTAVRYLILFGDGVRDECGWRDFVVSTETNITRFRGRYGDNDGDAELDQNGSHAVVSWVSCAMREHALLVVLIAYCVVLMWSSDYAAALKQNALRLFRKL